MTLWQGRFSGRPSDELLQFTVSLPFDIRLWRDDITGSRAHVRGLVRGGILDGDEAGSVLAALDQVAASMLETERTMNELQFVTGLDTVDQAPALLQNDVVPRKRAKQVN